MRWAEWLVCVPLLMYVAVSLDGTNTYEELGAVLSMGMSIVFGFLMQFQYSMTTSSVLLSFSFLSFIMAFLFLYKIQYRISLNYHKYHTESILNINAEISSRKLGLFRLLFLLMPTFPIVYLLAFCNIITPNQTEVAYMICDVSTKLLFSSVCMDINVEILQLVLASEMSINDSRRSFLRYVFHEVRVPLNSISMGICLLSTSNNLSKSEKENIIMMKEATNFMTDTLNDVLSIQKIEEGKLELHFAPFNLEDSIRSILSSLKGNIITKESNIIVTISSMMPTTLLGDKSRVEHILANLLSNALKFSPKGSKVELSVEPKVEDFFEYAPSRKFSEFSFSQSRHGTRPRHCTVLFSVKDYGPGISEADQKQLFIPYMQVRPGELQQGRGSGIGLAICKELAKLHGGDIECISSLGHGSTFIVTIPFQTVADTNGEFPRKSHLASSSTKTMSVHRSRSTTLSESLSSNMTDSSSLPSLKKNSFNNISNARRSFNSLLTSTLTDSSNCSTSNGNGNGNGTSSNNNTRRKAAWSDQNSNSINNTNNCKVVPASATSEEYKRDEESNFIIAGVVDDISASPSPSSRLRKKFLLVDGKFQYFSK